MAGNEAHERLQIDVDRNQTEEQRALDCARLKFDTKTILLCIATLLIIAAILAFLCLLVRPTTEAKESSIVVLTPARASTITPMTATQRPSGAAFATRMARYPKFSSVFGHFEPLSEQNTKYGERVQWSFGLPSWTSHDLETKAGGSFIVVHRKGVYRCSVAICLMCHEGRQLSPTSRVTMRIYKNLAVVKRFYSSTAGTMTGSILLYLNKGDSISVEINHRLWTPSEQENSLDINSIGPST